MYLKNGSSPRAFQTQDCRGKGLGHASSPCLSKPCPQSLYCDGLNCWSSKGNRTGHYHEIQNKITGTQGSRAGVEGWLYLILTVLAVNFSLGSSPTPWPYYTGFLCEIWQSPRSACWLLEQGEHARDISYYICNLRTEICFYLLIFKTVLST